jgi:hypothetical protein
VLFGSEPKSKALKIAPFQLCSRELQNPKRKKRERERERTCIRKKRKIEKKEEREGERTSVRNRRKRWRRRKNLWRILEWTQR